uniref:Uncharacterized protein n=1 Tax=Arundo donax TaxID=35708 RepID=A0A0A9FV22_ARUDO
MDAKVRFLKVQLIIEILQTRHQFSNRESALHKLWQALLDSIMDKPKFYPQNNCLHPL